MIPQEPDIKARQRAASLEVPDPPAPISPNPLIFKKRQPQPLLAILPIATVLVIFLMGAYPFIAAVFALTYILLIVVTQILSKSVARVEIIGSTIREYGPKGELYIEEDLRDLKTLLSKQTSQSVTHYYAIFPEQKILTFDSTTDRDFQLMKILQNWSRQKFEELNINNKVGREMLEEVNRRKALPSPNTK